MLKKYARINWQDAPSTNTPRNALFLNKMDKGIDDIDNAVVDIQNQIDQLVIDGDSSPAIAQALAGTEFSTLKEYRENNDAQLAAKASQVSLNATNTALDLKADQTALNDVNAAVSLKADKSEVTNAMTPRGTIAYASLPTSGNTVGWYYYCPDGDGTHGAGNYVWNGTVWYFGGTGDQGYNILKEDVFSLSDFKGIELGGWTGSGGGVITPTTVNTRCRCRIYDMLEDFINYTIPTGYNLSITQVDSNNIILSDTGWISGSGTLTKNMSTQSICASVRKESNGTITVAEARNSGIRIYASEKASISRINTKILSIDSNLVESEYVSTSKVVLIKAYIKANGKYRVSNGTGGQCTVNTSNDGTTNIESFDLLDSGNSLDIEPTQDALYIRSYCNSPTGGNITVERIDTVIGEIKERLNTTEQSIGEYDFVSSRHNDLSIEEDLLTYSSYISGSTNFETFLFFTDPHWFQHVVDEESMKKSIGSVEYIFNNSCADFVMCGGDWLQDSDTPSEAIYKLGRIDGIMRGKFKNKYHPILGNHDTNYQGTDTEGTPNSGTINQNTLLRLWFKEYGSIYYSFATNLGTRFYVFDTGTDWVSSMTTYRWDQCLWFAEKLIENDDIHSVIALHILTNQTSAEIDSNGLSPESLANNILLIAQAYNNKTTITVNGTAYDFSLTNGKVAFLICGHSHYDKTLTYLDIPIMMTVNAGYSSNMDLCLIDYSNSKLKTVRIGTGDNRELSIVV